MLRHIVQLSLRFRGIVIVLACVAIAYGLYVAGRAKLDVFPEFAPPQVVIQTEAPGLSPEEVEQLVTLPIENNINGAPDLVAIRSQSIQGLSAITATFKDGADIYRVRQTVNERLTQVAGSLPQGVKEPVMGPLTSSTSLTLIIGLTSTNRSLMELRTFADWTVRPRLLAAAGVAKVDIFGGEVRQLQIQVSPDRLIEFGLGLDDVLAAAGQSTGVRGAGFIENANQRIVLRTQGQSLSPVQLGEVTLVHNQNQTVRLKDVAKVVDAPEPKFGDALVDGERGVVMLINSQYRANTLDVTRSIESALRELAPAFAAEKIVLQPALFRPANFIEASLHNIDHSLLIGGILVVIVLFFFLLDWRTALISFTAIPLSLLVAVILLERAGISLNTLTLGGFAIAIGVVVDDAIIDVENILRRLRENRALAQPRSVFQVVLDGSLEVRSAVVYATFIVALVFLPVLSLSGVQGKLFTPLATAFILAILASLGAALTVTPALCLALLSRVKPHEEPRQVRWLKERHRHWLRKLSGHPRLIIGVALVLFLGAVAMLPFFGGEFLPDFQEGHFVLHMTAVPGTSLEESLRVGKRVSEELLNNPHIQSVSQEAGRTENGEDTFGPHESELHVQLSPSGAREDGDVIADEIRRTLGHFPGFTFEVDTPLAERIEETLSGVTAEVVINIFGDDLGVLDEKAAEVSRAVSGIKGADGVRIESQPGAPQIVIHLRPERLTQFGFRPVDILAAVETAYSGTAVAQVYDRNRVSDVVVVLEPASRNEPEKIGSLMLRNPEGLRLPLSQLADIYPVGGRYLIAHERAQRRQQVTCNVVGRDMASFVADLQEQLGKISFPSGVYPSLGGAAMAQKAARNELLVHSAIAGIGIILLLSIVFHNTRNLLLVLANVPFALIGGVVAAFATGGSLSLGSLVGFVTLFGLTTRNSIMMISHFEHLVQKDGLTWGLETAVRGAEERLAPILMTALVTALGLLPLAVSAEQAGHEIEGPMAIVILGGLITSTILNLLVLPTLALRYGRFEKQAPA